MNHKTYILPCVLLISAAFPTLTARALDASHYAENSALASGRWAKVKVSAAGMTLVTDTQLRNLGFANPQNVHVFGMGGRQLDYGLCEETHDDLPLIPSVRTSKGLVFFATDNITWKANTPGSETPYSHTIHVYDDNSYYFLSDIPLDDDAIAAAPASAGCSGTSRTTFTERALHEQELEPAGESGSQVWGEDFRSLKSQTFSFTFPDMADGTATAAVRFGSKTVSGTSSIIVSANGERLPSTASDKMSDSAASGVFGKTTTTVKEISGLDGKLDLGIEYSYSGVLYKARLDYIEAFYERKLKLDKGELHFYATLGSGEGVSVSGCSASTVIWDVTDPVAPLKVDYTLDGDKAVFSSTVSGYREYVAFDPESVSRSATPSGIVANQDIHGMETPDMVIVTYTDYQAGAEKIAEVHRQADGMRVHVLDADKIYNEFSGGKPDAGAFRRMLKMWHDRGADADGHRIQYALLMGKPLNDNKCISTESKNAGFRPMPIWESYEGLAESESYCNDGWLGMLDDTSDADFAMRTAKMQVAVGRIPCTTAKEALTAAQKIEKYVLKPDHGSWRNKVMLICDDEDGGEHLRQGEQVYKAMRSSGNGASHLYDRLYLDQYERVMTAVGATYPQATERMLNNFNDGVAFTNYIGHGSPSTWGHEHLWEWPSINSMSNKNLTFIFAATCSFAYWDNPTPCAAESLLLNADGGVIGMISAARSAYISMNGELNRKTMEEVFAQADDGEPLRWGDVYLRGQNRCTDTNALRYVFIGDPAIRIPGGSRSVAVETIDNADVTGTEMPELQAMSSVGISGTVRKNDGTVDTEFNGTVQLQLYDGERVITTLGNGNGVVTSYNDRDKRLSMTNAQVKNGQWSTVLRVPPEIQDLYTPALISSYAWSDAGREANGSFERLYVYGHNSESTDTEGPAIEAFYVNNPNLTRNLVSPNMIVFARLRDESGINVSQTGIGHSLTLCIDGKDYVEGLDTYFEQDLDDPDLGLLTFPLLGVEPGQHTLTLSAWDNANNVSKAELKIEVGAALDPVIFDITASQSTATSSVDFLITIDRPNSEMTCTIGVFDLTGRRLWQEEQEVSSDLDSVIKAEWDLCDKGGNRVPRGIYIYRATVQTPEGLYTSKSKKLAVTASQGAN